MDKLEKQPGKGKGQAGKASWFITTEYWLYPSNLAARVRKILTNLPSPETQGIVTFAKEPDLSDPTQKAAIIEALGRSESLRKHFVELEDAEAKIYNAQPKWHLRDLAVSSPREARELLNEFLFKAGVTSANYCWPYRDPGKEVLWRVHGWKHVNYRWVSLVRQEKEPALIRAEGYGGREAIRSLLLSAAKADPQAVGNLWKLFPTREEQAKLIPEFVPEVKPDDIPHPATLAAFLASRIYRDPDSEEAARARKQIRTLVSPSVSSGGRMKRGRPKSRTFSTPSIRLLRKMSYCLVKQAWEVDRFLRNRRELARVRPKILAEAYPWIEKVERPAKDGLRPEDIENFFSYGPEKAALRLLSQLTGMSVSLLEKMGIRSLD